MLNILDPVQKLNKLQECVSQNYPKWEYQRKTEKVPSSKLSLIGRDVRLFDISKIL